MKSPISLRIAAPLFRKLQDHLFPGDGDEHGAVLTVGMARSKRGTRLLVRDVFVAWDGIDYVPSRRGYRALTPQFIERIVDYCAAEHLGYLAVHPHQGSDSVDFSEVDLASHERGYPALLDITNGGPVGGLVFAENAVAGDIWTPNGRYELDHLQVVGPRMRRLYPCPRPRPVHEDPMYDRHALMFGSVGQAILSGLKVGIVGLGGGGSLISQALAHLGIGHIIGIDFDRTDLTNLPRNVGATRWDALALLTETGVPVLQRIGRRFARHKVDVARRVARRANPKIRFDAVVGNIVDESTARLLADADFIFLASDTIQSRLVFNALVYQYLIPGAQVGAKVPVSEADGLIGDIFTASRIVLPYPHGGCLSCHELIPPGRVQEEALSESERKEQRYVDDVRVHAPSVITLNMLSVAQPLNDFLMMFTGLYPDGMKLRHQMNFVSERELTEVDSRAEEACLHCGEHARSRRARGDRVRLPCRSNR